MKRMFSFLGGPAEGDCGLLDSAEAAPADEVSLSNLEVHKGEIAFNRGFTQYCIVPHKTDPKWFLEEVALRDWGLQAPRLVISVIGGADNFAERVSGTFDVLNFSEGLVQAALQTGAWVTTGGTRSGVMDLVGKAMKKYDTQRQVPCIGIMPFGGLTSRWRQLMRRRSSERPWIDADEGGGEETDGGIPLALIQQHHTHLVAVDSQQVGRAAFGGEAPFRAELEEQMSNLDVQKSSVRASPRMSFSENLSNSTMNVPRIMICVNGGKFTLRNILEAVRHGCPVVVCQGSGRAADLLATLVQCKAKNPDSIEELVGLEEAMQHMPGESLSPDDRQMLSGILRLSNYLSIYRGCAQLTSCILSVVLQSKGRCPLQKQLTLAVQWRCVDSYADLCRRLVLEKGGVKEALNWVLKMHKHGGNRWPFAHDLDSGANGGELDLGPLVTWLLERYSPGAGCGPLCWRWADDNDASAANECASFGEAAAQLEHWAMSLSGRPVVLEMPVDPWEQEEEEGQRSFSSGGGSVQSTAESFKVPAQQTTDLKCFGGWKKIERQWFKGPQEAAASIRQSQRSSSDVALNRPLGPLAALSGKESLRGWDSRDTLLLFAATNEVAMPALEAIWLHTEDPVHAALATAYVSRQRAEKEYSAGTYAGKHAQKSLATVADHFEGLATLLLEDLVNRGIVNPVEFLLQESKRWEGYTCFRLAHDLECKRFVDSKFYRVALDRYWMTPAPFAFHRRHLDLSYLSWHKTLWTLPRFWAAPPDFYSVPYVKAFTHGISRIVFVALYSWTVFSGAFARPEFTTAEAVLLIWSGALARVEWRQYLGKRSFHEYISDSWNKIDVLHISLLMFGIILGPFVVDEDSKTTEKEHTLEIIHALNLLPCYMRMLQVFQLSEYFGTLIVTLRSIMWDTLLFFFLLCLFCLAFSCAITPILWPQVEERRAKGVAWAFWTVFGSVDDVHERVLALKQPVLSVLTSTLLYLLCLLSNVVLVNLLIAILNSKYEKNLAIWHEEWTYYKVNAAFEFDGEETCPPPLNFIAAPFDPCLRRLLRSRHSGDGRRDCAAASQRARCTPQGLRKAQHRALAIARGTPVLPTGGSDQRDSNFGLASPMLGAVGALAGGDGGNLKRSRTEDSAVLELPPAAYDPAPPSLKRLRS